MDRLVVCHGDACAPNTVVGDDGTWTGHVDLGTLGAADRWADLAVATWSTQWNYGPGWEEPLPRPDQCPQTRGRDPRRSEPPRGSIAARRLRRSLDCGHSYTAQGVRQPAGRVGCEADSRPSLWGSCDGR
ncbi:phosphotransferase [Streptomyces sp. NBC_00390]|uniref:phosphotransferase n=1 Tax=Streptomyces sp. NBC_00390 TaxID=2975736 RepID=UPI003FCCCB73